eukprot:jgi/Botrbrau1/13951/Bobra.250_1s0006.2
MTASARQARGSFAATLKKIRSGSPQEALDASRDLRDIPIDAAAAKELAHEGTVLALLKVFEAPTLTFEEAQSWHKVLIEIMRHHPAVLPQLVAALAVPDESIVYAAAYLCEAVLDDDSKGMNMIAAGAAPALVNVLSHPSMYCQSAAVNAFTRAIEAPKTMKAFRKAGMVAGLLRILREAPPPECPAPKAPKILSVYDFRIPEVTRGRMLPELHDPSGVACAALIELTHQLSAVALEVAAHFDSPAALVRCLRQGGDRGQLTVFLLVMVLGKVDEATDSSVDKQQFTKALLAEGFGEVIVRLVRLDDSGITSFALQAACMVTVFARANSAPIVAMLVRYIEAGGKDIAAAVCGLHRVSLFGPDRGTDFVKSTLGKDPSKFVENLARLLVKEDGLSCSRAHGLLLNYIKWSDTAPLLRAAVAGGFIPGTLRLCREAKAAEYEGQRSDVLQVWESLAIVAGSGESRYVMQAVRCGLLAEVKSALTSGTHELQLAAVEVVKGLVGYPEALQQMRADGIWPALMVDLAGSSDVALLLPYVKAIFHMISHNPRCAAELLGGGALDMLQASHGAGGSLASATQNLGSFMSSMDGEGLHEPAGNRRDGRSVKSARRGGAQPHAVRSAAASSSAGPSRGAEVDKPARTRTGKGSGPLTREAVEAMREQAFNEADAWRARGGVAAAMRTIRSASHAKALEAALVLEHLVRDDDAPRELARKGTMRALLLLIDHPSLEAAELAAIHVAIRAVVLASHPAASQLAAAFSESEARIAFAAAVASVPLLEDEAARPIALAAGVARAMVAMLNHPSPYCRSGAAIIVGGAAKVAEPLQVLREAELVPALMEALRQPVPPRRLPPPKHGVFTNCRFSLLEAEEFGDDLGLPLEEPHLILCYALTSVIEADEQTAREVAATSDSAQSILELLRTRPEKEKDSYLRLLLALLRKLIGTPELRAFSEACVGCGSTFADALARMFEPGRDKSAELAIEVLERVLPRRRGGNSALSFTMPLMKALGRCIQDNAPYAKRAVAVLSLVAALSSKAAWEEYIASSPADAQRKAVENLSRFTVMMDLPQAGFALDLIVDHFKWGGPGLPGPALTGGIVGGIFRMLWAVEGSELGSPPAAALINAKLREALFFIIRSRETEVLGQALRCGLLPEVKSALRNGTAEVLLFALAVVRELLGSLEAQKQMREIGIWPSMMLELADTGDRSLLLAFVEELIAMYSSAPDCVDELVVEGVLERLAAATEGGARRSNGACVTHSSACWRL